MKTGLYVGVQDTPNNGTSPESTLLRANKMPTSSKFTRYRIVDTCLGAGWKHMDIAYCGQSIVSYQYRLEHPKGDKTPLNFNHYSRCAQCTAKLWHQRRLENSGRRYRRG